MPRMNRPSDARRGEAGKKRPSRLPFSVERLEDRVVLASSVLQSSDILDMANLDAQQSLSATRAYVPDELILAVRAAVSPLDPVSYFASYPWPSEFGSAHIDSAEWILSASDDAGDPLSLLKVRFNQEIPLFAAMSSLDSLPDVLWASLNFIYERPNEPQDLTPDDPLAGSQYHHALMKNIQAWDITLGAPSIIIAVTDDGVDIDHEDLEANIWVNPGEIAGNGIDDDGNGYIDDVNGWDFSSNDNNPNPVGSDSHGTHVAGIAAAVTNNDIGIAGTAGNATIMPIRFYGSGAWTSSVIAASYAYAVNNGAKIISTSYSIDHFWGDPTFTAGIQYLYDQGGLHFNSAGNDNTLNPARQQFDQSIFVSNTNSLDKKNGSSNYGWGIDIAAPGTSIYATLPGDGYGTKSGTSMSTPNVAGVAALIWSLHPTWTREQVVAQLLGTTDNIDALNPNYAGLLGSGRVNSYRALTETLAAPKIKGIVEIAAEGSIINQALSTITVELGSVFDPTSIASSGSWELEYAGFDDIFGTEDDTFLSINLETNYMFGTNRLKFNVAGGMYEGNYRFVAHAGGLANPFGTALDGNGDGIAGDDFVRNFQVDFPPATFTRVATEGSLIYTYATTDFTDPSLPAYSIDTMLLAGERLSVALVAQNASAAITLNVYDSQGLAHTQSATAGQRLVLNNALLQNNGLHYLEVVSTAATTFTLTAYLNARIETEISTGSNDLTSTAEDLSATSFTLLPGADRLAAVGVSNGVDFYSMQLTAGQSVSVVSTALTGSALSLQIRNSGGTILATGSTGSVTGQTAIANYVAATTGTYYIRLSGTGNRNYSLVATRESLSRRNPTTRRPPPSVLVPPNRPSAT
ncbi:MAG: S8 family serine peptidase [Planctomycetota bacterium]